MRKIEIEKERTRNGIERYRNKGIREGVQK